MVARTPSAASAPAVPPPRPEAVSDRPLDDPKDDALGYASFASNLARGLAGMDATAGLVAAVYGPWGAGKSTLLNFVAHDMAAADPSALVVRFNPWWFSSRDDLAKRLLGQLAASASKWKAAGRKVVDALALLADALTNVSVPYAKEAKEIARLLKGPPKDVPALKAEVSKALLALGRRVLVLVDDIDRLRADELEELFRVVKAVGDFPNVLYLLAVDKAVVARSLDGAQGQPGEAYLDKIVQVPFELPLPDRHAMRAHFASRVGAAVGLSGAALFDAERLRRMYFGGLDHFVRTPRDVVRLSNTLAVTFAAVRGEVDVPDFVAAETLRVFAPPVYELMRRGWVLSGSWDGTAKEERARREVNALVSELLAGLSPRTASAVERLLVKLFPRVEAARSGMALDPAQVRAFRKASRLCSPAHFDTYFRFEVSPRGVSESHVAGLLSLVGNPAALVERLRTFAPTDGEASDERALALLERLEDHVEELPRAALEPLLVAMLEVGDALRPPEDDPDIDAGVGLALRRLMHASLARMRPDARVRALRHALGRANAVSTAVDWLEVLWREHGHDDAAALAAELRLVKVEELEKLDQLVRARLEDTVRHGRLTLETPNVASVVDAWLRFGGEEKARQWLAALLADDGRLREFLVRFASDDAATPFGVFTSLVDSDAVLSRAEKLELPDALAEALRRARRAQLPSST